MALNGQTASSHKRHSSEDANQLWSKVHRSEFSRSIVHPEKFNVLSDNTLLRDVEDLLVVWLDENINQSDDCIDTELELRRLSAYLKTFTDLNDCVNHLTNPESKNNRVFLIVSGTLGVALLDHVQNFETIIWVYVFCENEALHSEWAKRYAKVTGVFVEKALLFSHLFSDLVTYSVQLTPMCIFQSDDKQKSIHDLNTEPASFMWFQLLIRIILSMCDNRDARAKKDLIDTCLKRYEGNTLEQNRIKEFEKTYTTGQAIYWYTKDSFLYRSVNRAFRTADIDIIYKFRFIIAEIHDQLTGLPRPSISNLVVHRGQVISNADMKIIEANQKKGFISMNTFLSTSRSVNQAKGFSAAGMDLPEGLESVRFQINVGQTRQPFADIDAFSAMPTEQEVLFSAGTVFRIDEVGKYDFGSIVHLTLTTEVDERFDTLVNHFMSEIGQSPTLATLGKFLILQGDYNRAQRYFQFLIDENGPDLDDTGREICYTSLGHILAEKGEYERAMDYYQQVLSIQQRTFEQNHPCFAKTHSNIGTIHMALGKYTEAIKNFQLSLSIELLCQPKNETDISISYNNLAQAYLAMEDYSNSKMNFEKALEKDQELCLDDIKHPQMAITYHNLGSLYVEMKQHKTAVEYFEKALDIQKASLPPQHPSRTQTEECLGLAYSQLGDHKAALEKCLSVLDTKLKVQPPNFPLLAKTYINLGTIYEALGDFNRTEEQFKRALQICQRHLSQDHADTATTYQLLGDLYKEMGKTSEAWNSYQRALDIFKRQEPLNSTALGKAYSSLGLVEKNQSKAVEYAEQGLAILLSVELIDKEAVAFAYNNLGMVHLHAEHLKEAIENYTKALNLGRESVNGDDNDPSLSTFYHNLGSAFSRQGDFEKALHYTHKAVDNLLKLQDPLYPAMGNMYNNLGSFYHELGENYQAIEFYQKAINVYKQPNAQNFRLLAKTYENIGSVYDSLTDWQKAVDYYKIALDLQLKNLELDDSDLISTYSSLGSVCEDREDYEMALTYFIPMLNIQEKLLSSSDPELAEAYDRVGTCYHLNKQHKFAVEHYEKALEIQRRQKASLAPTYQSLADAYTGLNELNTALHYYEMAVQSFSQENEEEESVDHYEDLCLLYKSLGVIQRRLQMFDESINNLSRSLDIYNRFLADGDKHDELRRIILESIAKVYEETGDMMMAETWRAKKETTITENTST